MLLTAVEIDDDSLPHDQVIVVGAGAVGITLAVDLARRGRSVTLLEAGPSMVSSQSQKYFESARATSRELAGLHLGRFRALGGTTNFWGGQLVRFDPIVFEQWPISRAELDPFYDRTLELLGMAEALMPDSDVMRRLGIEAPVLPPELSFFFTRWLPEPNLRVLFLRELKGSANIRVITECPVVAIRQGSEGKSVTGVEVIDGNGRRLTLTGAHVVLACGTIEIARLLSLPCGNGDRAPWSSNPWLGRGFMDHLDIVAGEIRPLDERGFHDVFDNAILNGIKYQPKLKLSESAQARERLLGVACHLIFNSSVSEDLGNAKLLIKGFLHGRLDGSLLAIPRRLGTLLKVGIPMVMRYLRHRRVYSPADKGIQLRLTAEQRMVARSGMHLRQEVDALGMPLIDMDWQVDGCEIETLARFSEIVRDYLVGSGLAEVDLDARIVARDPAILASCDDANHHMGMARMSLDEGGGVVDRNLRVHGCLNLFVAGASVYPTTGFANPTFTAMALGLRLAAFLEPGGA